MRISDWSSDVCSADLVDVEARQADLRGAVDDVGGDVVVRHAAGFLSVFWCRAMQWQVSLRGPGFSESPIPNPQSRPLNHTRPQQVVNVQCADDATFVVEDRQHGDLAILHEPRGLA